MSRNKEKITKRLIELGFTEPIDLFYHANDGWYAYSDELGMEWIGQHHKHVMWRLSLQTKDDVINGRICQKKLNDWAKNQKSKNAKFY